MTTKNQLSAKRVWRPHMPKAGPSDQEERRAPHFAPRGQGERDKPASTRGAFTKKQATQDVVDTARQNAYADPGEIAERGKHQVDERTEEWFEEREARKRAAVGLNRAKQLATQRKSRPAVSNREPDEISLPPSMGAEVPDSWEDDCPADANVDEEETDESEAEDVDEAECEISFIRVARHGPGPVLARVIAESDAFIGAKGYTLVDVGATSASEARAARSLTTKYHGIAPLIFPTDKPLPAGRGCDHKFEACDCTIEGRKVYLFNHTSYYMDTKAYNKIEQGSRVYISEHDLEPGQSVYTGNKKSAWKTKRSVDGQYRTYDSLGHLKFQNAASPATPTWWILAKEDKCPGSVVRVYDVGPKPPPEVSWFDQVWEFFKSFLIGKTTEVVRKTLPESKRNEASQRAQTLLMGVTTGGGVEEVTKSVYRVSRSLQHEQQLTAGETAEVVEASHEEVLKAQDRLFNIAHKIMVRADYRKFLRLKAWIRVLLIATGLVGLKFAGAKGLRGLALRAACGAVVYEAVMSLARELQERYTVMKTTSA